MGGGDPTGPRARRRPPRSGRPARRAAPGRVRRGSERGGGRRLQRPGRRGSARPASGAGRRPPRSGSGPGAREAPRPTARSSRCVTVAPGVAASTESARVRSTVCPSENCGMPAARVRRAAIATRCGGTSSPSLAARHDRREHVVPLDPPRRPGALNEVDVDPVLPRERTHDRRREHPARRPRRGADLLRRLGRCGRTPVGAGGASSPGISSPGAPIQPIRSPAVTTVPALVDDSDEDAGPGRLDLERRLVGLDLSSGSPSLTSSPTCFSQAAIRISSLVCPSGGMRTLSTTARASGRWSRSVRARAGPRPRAPARPAPARRSSRPA